MAISTLQTALPLIHLIEGKISCLNNLGYCYSLRYETTQSRRDLEASIKAYSEAYELTRGSDMDRIKFTSTLGSLLYQRFEITQSPEDLIIAQEVGNLMLNFISKTSLDNPHIYKWLSRICAVQLRIGTETKSEHHLNRSVMLIKLLLDNIDDASIRVSLLSNLSAAYCARYQYFGAEEDFKRGLECIPTVDVLDKVEGTHRATCLNNLSMLYHTHFDRTGLLDSLDKAVSLSESSVKESAIDNPTKGQYFKGLGDAYKARFESNGLSDDLTCSIKAYEEALAFKLGPTSMRATAGIRGGRFAYQADPAKAYRMLTASVELISLRDLREFNLHDQQYTLSFYEGAASDAAAMLLRHQNNVSEALRILELGRGAIIGAQVNGSNDITDLEMTYPDLSQQFRRLSEQFEGSRSDRGDMNIMTLDMQAKSLPVLDHARRHEINSELESLIDTIRQKPGFKNFLRGPSMDKLQDLSDRGPIVYLNCSGFGSDAILITKDGIRHVPLPNLSHKDLGQNAATVGKILSSDTLRTHGKNTTILRGILEWLWNVAVEPVLIELGFTETPSNDDEWPHIWWVPVGRLSVLPIHAAGYHTTPERSTIERVISSYVPTIRALGYARQQVDNLQSPKHHLSEIRNSGDANYSKPTASSICRP